MKFSENIYLSENTAWQAAEAALPAGSLTALAIGATAMAPANAPAPMANGFGYRKPTATAPSTAAGPVMGRLVIAFAASENVAQVTLSNIPGAGSCAAASTTLANFSTIFIAGGIVLLTPSAAAVARLIALEGAPATEAMVLSV